MLYQEITDIPRRIINEPKSTLQNKKEVIAKANNKRSLDDRENKKEHILKRKTRRRLRFE